MRTVHPFLLFVMVGMIAACDSREDPQPFFLTHVEEMRKLPQEDLLRMKKDILAKAAALPDLPVNDETPAGRVLSRGRLVSPPNRAAPVEGDAVLYELADGARVLRLENFRVANAPDLHVVLFLADGSSISRGLRGNVGSQSEPIASAEIGKVQIRSLLFDETFAEAGLAPLPGKP